MLNVCLNLIDNEEKKKLFEKIYETYQKQLFKIAYSILNNPHDAEIVVHNIFYNIVTSHINIVADNKDEQNIKNYLHNSVETLSLNLIREKKVRADFINKINEEEININNEVFLKVISSKEDYEKIIGGDKVLDEMYRRILYYYFVLDFSIPLIAKLMNKSPNIIQQQFIEGKNILVAHLSTETK